MKLEWDAPQRNKGPILEVLRRVLPPRGLVVEIASGTGQHAVHFAKHLPSLAFQPSDLDPRNLASIEAWVREAGLPNLRLPLRIDVLEADWGVGRVDAIVNSNMVHISPWECAIGLVRGAGRHLGPEGVLTIYGPFKVGGEHTAPSNAAFDESLRERDPRWGVRDLDAIVELARDVGLRLVERVEMPANNQLLVFRRTSALRAGS